MRFFKARDLRRREFHRNRDVRMEPLEPRIVLDAASSLGSVFGSPWQNPLNPLDANNDGVLAPNDVIEVLSLTNRRGAGKFADWSAPPTLHRYAHDVATVFADSNGDGFLSAVDTLQIVNRLNKTDAARDLEAVGTREDYPDFVDAAIRSLDLREGYGRVRTALEIEGDVDFVQLTPQYDRLVITGFVDNVAGGLSIQILDADLEVIESSADLMSREGVLDSVWSTAAAEITLPVKAGSSYYLRIQGEDPVSVGNYAVSVVNFDAGWWLPHHEDIEHRIPQEPTGSPPLVCPPPSVAFQGDGAEGDEAGPDGIPLEFDDRSRACIRSVLGRGADQDVYQFTATEMNLSVAVYGRGIKIQAFDGQGNELANLVDRPSRSGAMRLETDLVVGQLYFLVVSSPSDLPQRYSLDAHQYYVGIDPVFEIDPL